MDAREGEVVLITGSKYSLSPWQAGKRRHLWPICCVGLVQSLAVQELRAFSSLVFSKNKPLAAIDWHPKRKGMVAVAPIRNLTFNQRVDVEGMVGLCRKGGWTAGVA